MTVQQFKVTHANNLETGLSQPPTVDKKEGNYCYVLHSWQPDGDKYTIVWQRHIGMVG